MITFTLQQVTSFVGPAYNVLNKVTAAEDASPAAFVYKVVNQEFSHYASAADMETWPDNLAQAQLLGLAFYRDVTLSRTWDTVVQMNDDLDTTLRRVQSLADELTAKRGALLIDRTTVVTGS